MSIARYSGNLSFFHGIIDDVRIYNRALSATKIQQLYLLRPGNFQDLAVENVVFSPPSLNAGQSLNIGFRVRNLSTNTTPPSIVRIRLSSDAVLNEADPGLIPIDVSLPSLPPGASSNFTATATVPAGLLPGSYFVSVWVDPDRVLNQPSRANDIGLSSTRLTVLGSGGPVLLVSPTSRTVGADSSLTSVIIQNTGGGTLSWSASAGGDSWVHFLTPANGVAPSLCSALLVRCDANPTLSQRTANIVISAPGATPPTQIIVLTQAATAPPPPTVSYFDFSAILSPQQVNVPFQVTIRAMDASVQPAQVQANFSGPVELRAEAGGNINPRYVNLISGQWGGTLSLDTEAPVMALLCVTTTGARTEGRSGTFAVQNPAGRNVSVQVTTLDEVTGLLLPGATVVLQPPTGADITATTDTFGNAALTTRGAGTYRLLVQKTGYLDVHENVYMSGTVVAMTVRMGRNKPPVVLVPGMMGSAAEGRGLVGRYPVLPAPDRWPAKQESLRIHDPNFLGLTPGWAQLASSLQDRYRVYEAPWDWRIPVIRPDGANVAWRLYLVPVIERAKQETGRSTVDVVAHSMGGLLVRAYVQDDYYTSRNDIGRFAMLGTPNLGSAKAYPMWFGGQPEIVEDFYDKASKFNYEAWTGLSWNKQSQVGKMLFYRQHIKALGELLPVYPEVLSYGPCGPQSYPEQVSNALGQLNQSRLERFSKTEITGKVYTKVFYSAALDTIARIKLNPPAGSTGIQRYPHGMPRTTDPIPSTIEDTPFEKVRDGDETVLRRSVLMASDDALSPFATNGEGTKSHAFLMGEFADSINAFLDEERGFLPAGDPPLPKPPESGASNRLVIALGGRCEPWILNPRLIAAGISPTTSAFTNGWTGARVNVGAEGASFEWEGAEAGRYQAIVRAFPGELIFHDAGHARSNALLMTNLTWIGSSNGLDFSVEFDPEGTNGVTLVATVPAPTNTRSFESNGVCHLAWDAPVGSGAAAYRIYARREDEALFQPVVTTTSLSYNTGQPWVRGGSGTNWFFAVVSVGANELESPYSEILINSLTAVAGFTADVVLGTPPLAVMFTNQSQGSITNWAWDFDSDGNIDSTAANPTMVYAQPGSYTVSLTVNGPDGQDVRVAVGFIDVFLPVLQGIRVLPNSSVEMYLSAQAGRYYEIQASTNLAGWTTLMSLTATNDMTAVRDLSSGGLQQRFYRVVVP